MIFSLSVHVYYMFLRGCSAHNEAVLICWSCLLQYNEAAEIVRSERKDDMEHFEYKVVVYDTTGFFGGNVDVRQVEIQLNLLGDEGWEMVSCTSTNQSYGATKSVVCIFKRRREY